MKQWKDVCMHSCLRDFKQLTNIDEYIRKN